MTQDNGAWRAGSFAVKTQANGVIYERRVAGWLWQKFALDFRVWDDEDTISATKGWLLSHVPTGFQILGVPEDLAAAQAVAERVANAGDWDFTDPAAPPVSLKSKMATFKKNNPHLLWSTPCFSPFWPQEWAPTGVSKI